MKQCFDNWNALKRYQTLEDIAREKNDEKEAQKMELLKYKTMAKMELSLRAIQREMRANNGEDEE